MIEFKLPDIGEGIAEGEIVQWLVAEGATVEEHQPVVEVMTDKATVEVPAPAAGTVSKLLVGEGDTVPVGDVIFHLDEGGAGGAAPRPRPRPRPQRPGGGGGGGELVEFKLPTSARASPRARSSSGSWTRAPRSRSTSPWSRS